MENEPKHPDVAAEFVPEQIMATLNRPHPRDVPGISFAWMLSYSGSGARQNIRYFENGVRHCKLDFPIRVFFSTWSDAIVVTFVPLEAIREPHIMEWYSTYFEAPVEEAKARLEQYPKYPYDGRNADTVRAEMILAGGPEPLLAESERQLDAKGIKMLREW